MTATDDTVLDTAPMADVDEPGAPELVPLDSLTAEHTGRWTFLIVDGAAFMMQAMEPVIAEVTGRYSAAFQGDPGGRAIRSIDSCCAGPTAGPRRWPRVTGCVPCTSR